MPRPILLGRSQFTSLREAGCLYVDKSRFVCEVLDAPAEVVLYPRPRRFGKTLNMSMLQAFFEVVRARSSLFRDLQVWQNPAAMAHFQQHPVVSLTFKDVKHRDWPNALLRIRGLLAAEVARHQAAIHDGRLDQGTRDRLLAILHGDGDPGGFLLDLCVALHLHHGTHAHTCYFFSEAMAIAVIPDALIASITSINC